MNTEKETKENDVNDIFNIHGFGAKGEWKTLDGACLEKDTGE
jgi:protein kinase C substrate 80K-H